MIFQDWLNDASKIILFDGGMGTEIIKRGIKPGKLPDLLNIEQPEIIIEIHEAYYNAGSDMCQTCTFSSNEINLRNYHLESKIKDINEKALENLKRACPPNRLRVGDIGPTGTYRPPVGNATIDQWHAGFLSQVKSLEKGVDLWHVETISDIEEMLAAIQAIRTISRKPIIGSMTYRKTKKGFFTIMGDSLLKCVQALEKENVDVIGTNCTLGSKEMINLIEEMKKVTDKPLSIKPNAGLPHLEGGTTTTYEQPINEFVSDVRKMINMGVKVVGGCCGTSPETINALHELIISF